MTKYRKRDPTVTLRPDESLWALAALGGGKSVGQNNDVHKPTVQIQRVHLG